MFFVKTLSKFTEERTIVKLPEHTNYVMKLEILHTEKYKQLYVLYDSSTIKSDEIYPNVLNEE